MSSPVFSVVIPAYNAPGTIGSSIESVLSQTRSDLELIVVDDGSVDDTRERVAGYERRDARVRLVRQENQGVAGARNTGIGLARGELVSFLDNDDLWLPRYLESMHAALDRHPRAGFAYTDGWTLDDQTRRIWKESTMSGAEPPESPPEDPAELMVALVRRNFILSSATVRRRVLEDVGGFDPSLSGVDEYDLWLRIAAAGHAAARAPGRLVIQRDRAGSQSKDELMMMRGLCEVMRRVDANPALDEQVRAVARRQWRHWDRIARAISHGAGADAMALRGRRYAGRIKRALAPGPPMYDTPPAEISAAFPDLHAV